MTPLAAALLAAVLALGAWRLVAPGRGRRARIVACAAAAALALAQVVAEGFTWQFVPAWLLLIAAGQPLELRRRWPRWLAAAGLLGLAMAALAAWVIAPAPQLPMPTGPHPVGSQVFRLTDHARPETATDDPADRRQFNVQAWYPAAAGAGLRQWPYMDGLGQLPGPVSAFPAFVFRRFGETDTHAAAGAPISNARAAWPVVIFSPGFGAPRAFGSGLAAELASRGYVVLALDHPYESAVAELADGRIVPGVWRAPAPGEDWALFMERLMHVRAADMRYVLDQLEAGAFGPGLDQARIAAIGHSFGGATAALAAGEDPRIRAAVNIDGAIWAPIAAEAYQGPFMLIQSDREETGHGELFNATNGEVLARAARGAWRFEVGDANHFSFTDAPLFFTPPGQWLLARFIGGGRGAAQTQRATAEMLDAFLSGRPEGVEAVARRHRVLGGRIQ